MTMLSLCDDDDLGPTVKCEVTTVPGRPSSSYATAVSIYSTKLGGTVNGSVRTRPVSANMHRNQGIVGLLSDLSHWNCTFGCRHK